MSAARTLALLAVLLPVVLASPHDAEAAEGCSHCGCRKIKKVTRLVKTMKEIEVPVYQSSQTDTFYPDKGAVCHSGYRCETFYKPHVQWCGQECRIHKESCEHVQHCVDKGHCTCDCTCSEEQHHKEHIDYDVHWTRSGCVSCETVSGCKVLYGTTTCGCQKLTCVKEPTGEMCAQFVPDVRWVNYNVCQECDHDWSCDSAQFGQLLDSDATRPVQPADSNGDLDDDEKNGLEVRAAPLRSPRKVGSLGRLLGFARVE